jgi:uncharacterized protein (TIGR00299 family) protein
MASAPHSPRIASSRRVPEASRADHHSVDHTHASHSDPRSQHMKLAYIDCIAGASGDMLLGALLDAGLPRETLEAALAGLPNAEHFHLHVKKVSKNGFGATKVDVHAHDHAPERKLADLLDVVAQSSLPERVKQRAARVFRRICEVEAGIHGMSVDDVHLHEVGGIDAIVDIVGVLAGFDALGVEQVVVSPLPMGRGFVTGAHGQIPLPAPATLGLLRGVPLVGSTIDKELVTPTGAALLTELATAWGPLPAMTLHDIGYGAGTRDLPIPNVLRLMLGEAAVGGVHASDAAAPWTSETITVLETNLDNERGEAIGHLSRRLMAAGALDVMVTPAQMKKDRPAHLLKVLARPDDADRLERLMFEESHTLGIRRTDTRRDALPRAHETVQTKYGPIRVKLITLPDGSRRVAPEYEDCAAAAEAHRAPLAVVTHAAEHAGQHAFGVEH